MSTIDIDRDAAHDAAQAELSKSIYPKPSLMDVLSEWFERLLYRLTAGASEMPGGWLTITVLAVLVVAAVVIAVRIARRAMRSSRGDTPALFDDHVLSAAEHRATAERHAAAGDWAPAIRHRLRAIARQLEDTGVVQPVPGRTATELARTAGGALPALAADLHTAAEVFNDVTYGERPATEDQYRMITALDDGLARHTPTSSGAGHGDAHLPWAEVR
ncbi:membrane protein [Mycolicibacterium parafortuitum]|uniref:Membrane protein n=1 Tax=Mycolicibacterium parafortuitum TaxID=39692 RepID=A0A7I7U0U0_MYCPF|nr:DUF4129 domain-containing protein [Mycolicibacterium parafortuitum]PQE01117.1 hypothetical protein CYL16_10480 [Mycobacterium sp. EPG1]BBY75020.1 membrane protein [Mycolicibacterium parafortuitum]